MGSPSLSGPLMATSPLTTRSRNPVTSPHCPSRPTIMVPSPRAKWCQSPEQEAEADHPGEPTPQRQREEDPLAGQLGDSHCEAFHKDSELLQWIRWTYFRTHALTFLKEDTYILTEVFKELAEMSGLLGTEVCPVHDQWVGRKVLHSAYHMVRGSTKDLHFFRTVVPLKSPKIIGLLPRGSKATGRPLLLSMVWESGTKLGDHGESPLHWALLPQTSMQEVPVVFYHHIRQNAVQHPRVSMHALPQRQWRWSSGNFNWTH